MNRGLRIRYHMEFIILELSFLRFVLATEHSFYGLFITAQVEIENCLITSEISSGLQIVSLWCLWEVGAKVKFRRCTCFS